MSEEGLADVCVLLRVMVFYVYFEGVNMDYKIGLNYLL